MNAFKVAITGCGKIAGGFDSDAAPGQISTHAAAYEDNDTTYLCAVHDSDMNKAVAFAKRWGGKAYKDLDELLERAKPEIISICSPDEEHLETLGACLRHNSVRAVWCEKPLVRQLDIAEKIVADYQRRGVHLFVNYQRRSDQRYNAVKAAVSNGVTGALRKVVIYYSKGVFHSGSHAIDFVCSFLSPPSEVNVLACCANPRRSDPTVDALMFCGGVPVYLIGCDENDYELFQIDIWGAEARILIADFGRTMNISRRRSFEWGSGLGAAADIVADDENSSFKLMLKNITDVVSGKDVIAVADAESTLETVKICAQLVAGAGGKE